jgi:hypothetical protein
MAWDVSPGVTDLTTDAPDRIGLSGGFPMQHQPHQDTDQ